MPLKALLDPQGKAVTARLRTMGMKTVLDARIGKHMELSVEAKDLKAAEAIVERACKEMLHNPIMESYEYAVATEAPAKKAAAKPAAKKTAAKKAAPAKKAAAKKPAVKKAAAKPAAKKTAAKKAAPAKKAAAKKPAVKKAAPKKTAKKK